MTHNEVVDYISRLISNNSTDVYSVGAYIDSMELDNKYEMKGYVHRVTTAYQMLNHDLIALRNMLENH